MKRYLLFQGSEHYPLGGWDDYTDAYDTVDEAKSMVKTGPFHWYHVVDTTTMTVVCRD